MRIRVAKIDSDREPEKGRGPVIEGAGFALPINSFICPFKVNGRVWFYYSGGGAWRGGVRQIYRAWLAPVPRHSCQIWAR